MSPTRLAAFLTASALCSLAAAAPADAAQAPHCDSEVWSRPGLERPLQIHCTNADRVRIAEQPAAARGGSASA